MGEPRMWRGMSMYQVNHRLQEIGEAAAALRLVERSVKDRMSRLEEEAKERLLEMEIDEFEGMVSDDLYLGYWPCSDSPIRSCIYNVTDDPMRDECLFCHDPAERK